MNPIEEITGQRFAEHLCTHWNYTELRRAKHHIVLETTTSSPHRITVVVDQVLFAYTLSALVAKVAAHRRVNIEDVLRQL